jgi:hypothetical protein
MDTDFIIDESNAYINQEYLQNQESEIQYNSQIQTEDVEQ